MLTRKVLVLSMSMWHLRLTILVMCFMTTVTWDNFLLLTVIFDFQSRGIAVNIRKLLTLNRYAEPSVSMLLVTFCLMTQVTQNTSRNR